MDFVIILIISIVLLLFGAFVFEFNMKEMKKFEKNEELDNIANKYPENVDMCKQYLKMLKKKKFVINLLVEKKLIMSINKLGGFLYEDISNRWYWVYR